MYLVVQPHLFRPIISPCLFSELTLHQKPSGETGPSVRKVTTFKLSINMPKETKRIRGTARFYEDESFDFIPQQQGAPVQKEVTRVRKSTSYQTNGEKESSYVVHLNVDANSTDPAAELTDNLLPAPLKDMNTWCSIVKAMARMECGKWWPISVVAAGWHLATPK